MPLRRSISTLGVLCLIAFGLSSCAVRRGISRLGVKTTQPLLTANESMLLGIISRNYERVHDFSATVDMTPALGSAENNRITEYKDVRAYILFRKPDDIRIVGLYPVIRSKAFDMVSDGTEFKLYIPSKDRFITGANNVDQPSKNKLENLRPQHLLDALMVRPVSPDSKLLLENFTDEANAFYILYEVQQSPDGQLRLLRTIWFDRLTLTLARQLIYDNQGNILTDARYSGWRYYENTPFPKHVEINRPRDEYGVVIDLVKMDINKGLNDDRFVLDRPPGSTLQVIGQPPAAQPSAPANSASRNR